MARVGAKAHGAAQFIHALQFAQFVDDAFGRGRFEFGGISLGHATNIAREFDDQGLHAQADAEVRHFILAGIANGLQHTIDATLAEAAGHQNAIINIQLFHAFRPMQLFGFNPTDVHFQLMGKARNQQRFLQALVGILVFDILADNADIHFIDGIHQAVQHVLPLGKVAGSGLKLQLPQNDFIHALFGETNRHFVNAFDVTGGDDRIGCDVAEQRDLFLHLFGNFAFSAAQ